MASNGTGTKDSRREATCGTFLAPWALTVLMVVPMDLAGCRLRRSWERRAPARWAVVGSRVLSPTAHRAPLPSGLFPSFLPLLSLLPCPLSLSSPPSPLPWSSAGFLRNPAVGLPPPPAARSPARPCCGACFVGPLSCSSLLACLPALARPLFPFLASHLKPSCQVSGLSAPRGFGPASWTLPAY